MVEDFLLCVFMITISDIPTICLKLNQVKKRNNWVLSEK